MITSKDRIILRHVDEFKFITIEQARLLAFPNMKRGYEYVRTRLHYLVKEKRLKIIYNSVLKIKLFIDSECDLRSISAHRVYLMDFYCNLLALGAEVEKFELERQWADGKVRSDAFCIFTYGGGEYRFRNLIEVNTSQNKVDLRRYDIIKDEIIKANEGRIPRIILLDDRDHAHYDTEVYQVIRLDYNLNNLPQIFL